MVAILLTAQILANTVQSIFSKEYARNKQASPILYSLFSGLLSLVYFLVIAKFNLEYNSSTLLCGIFCSFGIILSYVGNVMAIRNGPMAITGLIQAFSLSVPTIYGIFF